ncbi:hypothetical protein ACLOJK_012021 [Asimina triloba]
MTPSPTEVKLDAKDDSALSRLELDILQQIWCQITEGGTEKHPKRYLTEMKRPLQQLPQKLMTSLVHPLDDRICTADTRHTHHDLAFICQSYASNTAPFSFHFRHQPYNPQHNNYMLGAIDITVEIKDLQ